VMRERKRRKAKKKTNLWLRAMQFAFEVLVQELCREMKMCAHLHIHKLYIQIAFR